MTNYFEEIISLIKSEKSEEACRIFYKQFKNELIRFLKINFKWDDFDAETIVNDVFILLSRQIIEKKVQEINLAYLKQLCKFIGANSYRKSLREEKKLKSYFDDAKSELETEYNDLYNLDIELDECNLQEKQAIRSFSILDEKCQKLIKLKHIENLRHEEIIKEIREINNTDSSKSLLNRCMRKWRKLLENVKI